MFIPEYLKQVQEGVWERKEKVKSESIYMVDHYINDCIRILKSDKGHYDGMFPFVKKEMPEIMGKYKSIAAIGGGSPKFETVILQGKEVIIFDMICDLYQRTLPEFKKIFNIGDDVAIDYVNAFIEEPFTIKDCDCVTFTHFLEHCQSWEVVKEWIAKQIKDIVIYMPCIEAAQNINWHHFHDHNVDHNTFFTQDAIKRVGVGCGYNAKSIRYSDDMLIYLWK